MIIYLRCPAHDPYIFLLRACGFRLRHGRTRLRFRLRICGNRFLRFRLLRNNQCNRKGLQPLRLKIPILIFL